ncbi:MAG: hypothetical protein ACYDCQ_08090 [Dehalococcoidia bacterium]
MNPADGAGRANDALPPDAIEAAILAFDAGNHAWGRYRHFVLSNAPHVQAIPTDAVRAALQEAAVCVPDAQAGDTGPLLAAVQAALAGLRQYVAAVPAEIQHSELNEAIDALDEAAARLQVT